MMLDNLEYRVATKEDHSDILEFLLTYFYKDEPCTKALKFTKDEVRPLFEGIVERCLRFPVSTVVRMPNGVIVAVMLNSVWRRTDDAASSGDFDNGEQPSENMLAFVRFVNRAHEDLWNLVPSNVEAVLHREISSVGTPYQRNGIATKMVTANLTADKLKQFNIGGVISETSSHANQMLLAKNGFRCLKELPYAEMRNASGVSILTPVDGATGLRLNFKPIDEFNFDD
ncbi:unnamed protein product [Caenorhabditis bovis]|uniref:aralkylamine N-acetyltransferase n=1 Tax=Caenorhabditis bovis TaxID=2654633 RepID=A0A8S1E4Y5_9PELO|nr:unnamed protein product [Caenorhabditis bovis]